MNDSNIFTVGIGASAGGLAALKALVSATPKQSGMAYIVVQHLDPTHESILSELLGKASALPVLLARDGQLIEADYIYVIPPDSYLGTEKGHLRLIPPQQQRGMRKAVDHLFRSLAHDYGPCCAGIVLSGSGSDGTAGLRAIKAAGGLTMVQTPATAEHGSMPLSAINAGIIDRVVDVDAMPGILTLYARYARNNDMVTLESKAEEAPAETAHPDIPENLDEVAALLERHENFTLRQYKHGTVSRRICRRMNLTGADDYRQYLSHLRRSAEERKQLTRDLLINVTDFFRDPDAFRELEERAILPLLDAVTATDDIRI